MTPCESQREFFLRTVRQRQQLSLEIAEKPTLNFSRLGGEVFRPVHMSGGGASILSQKG